MVNLTLDSSVGQNLGGLLEGCCGQEGIGCQGCFGENVIIGKPIPAGTGMKCYSNIHLNTDSMIEEEEDEDLILTEDLEDDAPAAPMAEAPVEEPSAEEEEPMLDFDFEEMIPSKDDTEE
jgi:DNA-directed RNA polymerase subunit beta'